MTSPHFKERPILFSGEMVHAILEGRKTQTRRVLRDQAPIDLGVARHGAHLSQRAVHHNGKLVGHRLAPVNCPYGQPGDRLWVRETIDLTYQGDACYAAGQVDLPPDGRLGPLCEHYGDHFHFSDVKKLPSIFMPRWASRITLEIAGVRVERLQDINHADAIAEGVACVEGAPLRNERLTVPQVIYAHLWDKINGAGAWDTNPWVWVVEFKRA